MMAKGEVAIIDMQNLIAKKITLCAMRAMTNRKNEYANAI